MTEHESGQSFFDDGVMETGLLSGIIKVILNENQRAN